MGNNAFRRISRGSFRRCLAQKRKKLSLGANSRYALVCSADCPESAPCLTVFVLSWHLWLESRVKKVAGLCRIATSLAKWSTLLSGEVFSLRAAHSLRCCAAHSDGLRLVAVGDVHLHAFSCFVPRLARPFGVWPLILLSLTHAMQIRLLADRLPRAQHNDWHQRRWPRAQLRLLDRNWRCSARV